ncbi:MAG: hypothetical protein JWN70_2675 [Planctomycetaceae bacterium]|nr:hypothetical protein [Planctomycetaceae bacterium]
MEEKRKPRPWLMWFVVALTLLTLYVLSLGPVNLLAERRVFSDGDLIWDVLVVFYWPLIWFNVNQVQPFHGWLQAYCDLWTR